MTTKELLSNLPEKGEKSAVLFVNGNEFQRGNVSWNHKDQDGNFTPNGPLKEIPEAGVTVIIEGFEEVAVTLSRCPATLTPYPHYHFTAREAK